MTHRSLGWRVVGALPAAIACSVVFLFLAGCPGTMPPPPDPCDGVTCADGETCVDGQCVAGNPDPCDGVTCADGEACVDGQCVATDPCDGVTCADGETCVGGQCMADALVGVPADGQAFYTANACTICHGADAQGTPLGDPLIGTDAATVLGKLDGSLEHTGPQVAGVTEQDAADVVAWIASL